MESLPFQSQKKRPYWDFYCPVCKAHRRSTYWPSLRPRHFVAFGGFTVFFTLVFWSVFKFKGVFVYFLAWAVFEFFYRLRARQSLICPHCGFDPYLYKYDVNLARQKIEKFFSDKKIENEGGKKTEEKTKEKPDAKANPK